MEPSKCMILVPAYREIDFETERSLRECERAGFHVWRMFGVSGIDTARMIMANGALQKGYEGLLWVDADMGFDVSAAKKISNSGLPIVTALCALKDGTGRPCVQECHETDFRMPITEVEFAGCGFLFTAAKVYRDIEAARYGHLEQCSSRWGKMWPYFMPFIENGSLRTEDFAFSARAKNCGYKIYADTTVNVKHFGRYAFEVSGSVQQQR